MFTCILAFILGLVLGLAAGVHWARRVASAVLNYATPAARVLTQQCDVCGRQAGSLRCHDGRYLCGAHKG